MGMDHQPDERLMQQVALGKRECVGTLLRRHASELLTFIQRMIGDRHRSEDLFQEVFLADRVGPGCSGLPPTSAVPRSASRCP